MSQVSGLTEDEGLKIACSPNDFRTYLGVRLRGMIARNDHQKWFILEQPNEGWNTEMFSPLYITKHGREIELSSIQLDDKAFAKEHFHGVTAWPLGYRDHFKKMFIVGAGASFDCLSGESRKLPILPLSNNIFKSDPFNLISEFYPAVHRKFSQMGSTRNLEEYFTGRWKRLEAKARRDELAELMNIQFYLHHLFLAYSFNYYQNSECNYRALVEKIHDHCADTGEKVAVVSYNYDCILDQAIEGRYGNLNTIEDYLANETRPISLLKPHGSCDWVRPIEIKFNSLIAPKLTDRLDNDLRLTVLAKGLFQRQFSMADIHNITEENLLLFHKITKDKTKYFQRNLNPMDYKTERAYYPNMLLPYNEKDEFVMPYFHVNHLDQILQQVEEIYIIGWKGEEKTMMNKFKNFIGDRPIHITVIDEPSDKPFKQNEVDIYKHLKKYLVNAEICIKKVGFSGYMKYIVDAPDFNVN